jgi:predicted CXXCH cytochrome family protein
MKQTAILLAVLATVVISAPAWAQHIAGSPHDLSTRLGTGEICLSCHAPHGAPNAAYGPLWNHALTQGNGTTSTFVGPSTSGFTANGAANPLYGHSLLCMGCHDGVTAVGDFNVVNVNIHVNDTTSPIQSLSGARSFVNKAGQTVYPNDIGTDLSYVHPVGIVYPALGTTSSSFNTATASSGYGGVTTYKLGSGSTSLSLEVGATANTGNTVGCSTCHNPHDDTTAPPFLKFANTNSALCLTCHIK